MAEKRDPYFEARSGLMNIHNSMIGIYDFLDS